jgi:hypothetical protein
MLMRTALLALALAFGITVAPHGSGAPTGPPIRGTFLQFRADDQWRDAKLEELFHTIQSLGLSRIVVQWTVVGTTAFYSSNVFESVPDPPLERLLALADRYGVKVRVGLAHDSEFWDRITPSSPTHDVDSYLKGRRLRSTAAARELLPVVTQHPSFEGWFLTEEVDDVNWVAPERRALLRSYLARLRNALRRLGSPQSVAVSAFSNAHCDPSTLEQFWRELVSEAGIEVVFFQDGVGTHKLELSYLPLYLTAMKRAAVSAHATLGVVVELFDQVGGLPVTAGPFRAVPASVDRIARQLALAQNASTGGTIAFSVPDYMTPAAGSEAQHLYEDYVKRYCGQDSGIRCPSSVNEGRGALASAAPSRRGEAGRSRPGPSGHGDVFNIVNIGKGLARNGGGQ